MQLLSTHADRQGVDISVAVCVFLFVCLFVRSWISPKRIKLAASNFARRFIGFRGRECPILAKLCSPRSPKSDESTRTNRPRRPRHGCPAPKYVRWAAMARATGACVRATRRIGVCVDIGPYGRPRRQMYLFFYSILAQGWNSDRPC